MTLEDYIASEQRINEKRLAEAREIGNLEFFVRTQGALMELETIRAMLPKLDHDLTVREPHDFIKRLLRIIDETVYWRGSNRVELIRSTIEACLDDGTVEEPIPISRLGLSNRTSRCLKMHDIYSVGELTRCTEKQIRDMRCIGKKSMQEIREALTSMGLTLRGGWRE